MSVGVTKMFYVLYHSSRELVLCISTFVRDAALACQIFILLAHILATDVCFLRNSATGASVFSTFICQLLEPFNSTYYSCVKLETIRFYTCENLWLKVFNLIFFSNAEPLFQQFLISRLRGATTKVLNSGQLGSA